MQKVRCFLLVIGACALLATPSFGLPSCSTVNMNNCFYTCAYINGWCLGITYPTCGTGTQYYTYHCNWGEYLDRCTCDGAGCTDSTTDPIPGLAFEDMIVSHDVGTGSESDSASGDLVLADPHEPPQVEDLLGLDESDTPQDP